MIHYDIQHFGDTTWLPWLVGLLQHPQDSFRISYDAPQEAVARLDADMRGHDIAARNLVVERSVPIRWCGPSQVVGQIHALRRALAFEGWEFFVNLSGSCAPLQPRDQLIARLTTAFRQGETAHFNQYMVRQPVTLPEEDPDAPEEQERLGRLNLVGNARLLEMFRDPDFFPLKRAANRLYVHCREPEDAPEQLHVSCPDPEEMAFRKEYLARYPHHCGRAWFILHRSACEALVAFFDSSDFEESARFFLTAFEPDESFLQTLIMNGLVLSPEVVGPDALRTFGGGPRVLNDDSMGLLDDQQNAFFGRKIQHPKAELLRRLIETRVRRPFSA